ncbi:MAG: LysM peptidoglycan-binding domain-containing protein [Bacillota bacterium]
MCRRIVTTLALVCMLCRPVTAAHFAYRPLVPGIVGEDVAELQVTLAFFGFEADLASGELDAVTWRSLLGLLRLEPSVSEVAGDDLSKVYWFWLARQWPRPGYIVQEGDTFELLEGVFGVPARAIQLVNGKSRLVPGERLLIPAEYTLHRVLPGQTLVQVAETYRTTVRALCRWNGLADPGAVGHDDRLVIVLR